MQQLMIIMMQPTSGRTTLRPCLHVGFFTNTYFHQPPVKKRTPVHYNDDLVHTQAVRRHKTHTKPRDGDVTSKCKYMSVNPKAHYRKRLNNNHDVVQGGVTCVEM